jgi:WD40 repeat protein
MIRKKPTKKIDDYIISKHEIKEEDIIFEKNNITTFKQREKKIQLSFQTLLFPVFEYEKSSLLKLEYEKPPEAECFTINFDEKANFLACGYSNGFVNVFNLKEKKIQTSFKVSSLPITCLKWNYKKLSTLLISSSDGLISHWHSTSGKMLYSINEGKNSINSIDYSNDFKKFCTGGKDVKIRLYDDNMKTLISTIKPYDDDDATGRIFCVKFHPENTNTIFSGGWDKNINIFDTREGKLSNTIYGPKICGEGLDIKGFYILSTGWEKGNQVQIWDTRNLKCVTDGIFENGNKDYDSNLYCGKFNKCNYDIFAVGGVNKNIFRLFDFEYYLEEKDNDGLLESIIGDKNMYSPCYSVDFVRTGDKSELFAYSCGDGGTRIFSINYE